MRACTKQVTVKVIPCFIKIFTVWLVQNKPSITRQLQTEKALIQKQDK